MIKINKNIKIELETLHTTLDDLDQSLNNHVAFFHTQGLLEVVNNLIDKIKYLKNYADTLKTHNKTKVKTVQKIDALILNLKTISAEINSDKKKKLKYPDFESLEPVLYLKYYLESMGPYLLEKIYEVRQIEKELRKFDPL